MAANRSGRIVAALLVTVVALAVAAVPASAVPFNEADFSGYATGQVLHADALAASGVNVANVEEAWTGAAVDSKGLGQTVNEVDRIVVPAQASKKTYGRGSGLELGLGVDQATENQLQLQKAEAAALPPTTQASPTIELNQAAPLAYASVLTGEAEARWSSSSTCVLGQDLAAGRGFAADVQLVDTGTSNEDGTLEAPLVAVDAEPEDPDRSVAWSYSHNFLDVQQDASGKPLGLKFGLSSEVQMTIAPVTIGDSVTLEFLGVWVLRATAGGVPGSAHVHFGPGEASPQTPVLNIIQDGEDNIIVTLQDILTDAGLPTIDIPGVAEIRVSQPPHKIGDQDAAPEIAANGTSASAALDVVSVELASGDLADIRFGHFEAAAQVPVGGIDCGVPVSKTASPQGVTVGGAFTVSIKVDNPFGCDMTVVKVVDEITTQGSAKFQVLDTNPEANSVPAGSNLDSGTIIWNNIGPIPKGGSKVVTTTIRAQGGGGVIKDIATATATLGNCEGEGEGSQIVGNSPPLEVPVVLKTKLPPTGVGTSSALIIGALALLSLAGVSVRSLRRNKA
jgi:hypothetical protein